MSRRKAPKGKPAGMWILDGAPSYKRGREGFETPKEAAKLAELEADDQCKEHGCAKWRCEADHAPTVYATYQESFEAAMHARAVRGRNEDPS